MDTIRFPLNSDLATLPLGFHKGWVLVRVQELEVAVAAAVLELAGYCNAVFADAAVVIFGQLSDADYAGDVAVGGSVDGENKECREAFESPQHLG